MSADDALPGIDDDDGLERGGVVDVDGGADEYTCPECGDTFDSRAKLGLHRFRKHGVRGSSESSRRRASKNGGGKDPAPKRERSSSSSSGGNSRSRRSRLVSETLTELADLGDGLRGRFADDGRSIADTIRRDADKMGEALAGLAERGMFAFLGPIIDAIFGAGGPLSVFVAFGPTLRKTLAAGGERRDRRDAARLEQLQLEYERILGEQGFAAAQEWATANGLEIAGA